MTKKVKEISRKAWEFMKQRPIHHKITLGSAVTTLAIFGSNYLGEEMKDISHLISNEYVASIFNQVGEFCSNKISKCYLPSAFITSILSFSTYLTDAGMYVQRQRNKQIENYVQIEIKKGIENYLKNVK